MSRTRTLYTVHTRKVLGHTYYPNYNNAYGVDTVVDWSGIKKTEDVCSDTTSPGPPYRWANNLSITHKKLPAYTEGTSFGDVWVQNTGLLLCRYTGEFWVSLGVTLPTWPPEAYDVVNASLSGLGATGWNKFQPAKPLADMGVFLGESRELPGQFRDAVKALKQLAFHPLKTVRNMSFAANQHLAIQFGWLPLLRDLEKFYQALKRTNEWLDRVKRNNNKWVHRGGTIASGGFSGRTGSACISPIPTIASKPPEGVQWVPIEWDLTYRIWFSAWFKYYIADFDSPATQLRLKARIYGLNNTPAVVWNLLPWSWLVDWFSNIGDNIDNLCPIDGLVARRPCVMRHVRVKYHADVRQRYKEPTGAFQTISASGKSEIESKDRFVASPFGFTTSWDDLTPRQWSILAALGIQRMS